MARNRLFREFDPGPRFAAITNCLAGSREWPTTVAARNCATPTIVFCACSAAFWKTYYTFDFVSRAKVKDRISHRLLKSLYPLILLSLLSSLSRTSAFLLRRDTFQFAFAYLQITDKEDLII